MKKPTNQKPQPYGATRNQKPNTQSMMTRLRAQYLQAGVTEQEFAMIQHAAENPAQAALAIALLMARLQEDGRQKPGSS